MHNKDQAALLAFDRQYIWHPYTCLPATTDMFLVESAQGCKLHLADGSALIDGMSSWWSAIHGYNHPILNEAIHQQTTHMAHMMFGGLTHKPAIELAQLLCTIVPAGLKHVFFADSGSVAIEVAIKMALQFWTRTHKKNIKHKLLTVRGGYHGDTFAAMSVCDPLTGMHHLFTESLMPNLFAPMPQPSFTDTFTAAHISELRDICSSQHEQIAAIILEPIVQGAGGMHFYAPAYLSAVRELCDEFNILLIADEIATGFGRTGKLFACEHAHISPDILCVGKALTGGYLSLAATLCNSKVADGIRHSASSTLMHGPTFMANPLACAVAQASIKLLLDSNWQENIQRIERSLKLGLGPMRALTAVNQVRILGAIGVVELNQPVDMQIVQPRFVELGVWIRPFGKLIYIMPPYIISDAELQLLTQAMYQVISNL